MAPKSINHTQFVSAQTFDTWQELERRQADNSHIND